MEFSPHTRFLFAHLLPGASLVCIILFLVDIPVEDGYRISLLEWSLDSDRVFPYLVTVGSVTAAVLGAVLQAARSLLVDGWALRRGTSGAGAAGTGPAAPAGTEEAETLLPPPGQRGRRPPPGPLAELYGNLGVALLVGVLWVAVKIVRGGGTEVFPGRVAYGVPLAGLAACALLFAAYRADGRRGGQG